MDSLYPFRPKDEPEGPCLPFVYRTNWEIITFFKVNQKSIYWSIKRVAEEILIQLNEQLKALRPKCSPYDIFPENHACLAMTFHLSEVPEGQYTNLDTVCMMIRSYLENLRGNNNLFTGKLEIRNLWRLIDTTEFGIYNVTPVLGRLHEGGIKAE